MRFNISTALYCVEMQPSTSGEILSKPDDTVRENGGLEPSRENDVTVVAMVDLDNDADSQYEGEDIGNFQPYYVVAMNSKTLNKC